MSEEAKEIEVGAVEPGREEKEKAVPVERGPVRLEVTYYADRRAFVVTGGEPGALPQLERLFYGRRARGELELHVLEAAFLLSRAEKSRRAGQTPLFDISVGDAATGKPLGFADVLHRIAPGLLDRPITLYKAYECIRLSGNMVRPVAHARPDELRGAQGPRPLEERGGRYSAPRELLRLPPEVLWDGDEKCGIIRDRAIGKALMSEWCGTLRYKMPPYERVEEDLKLDSLELVFLLRYLRDRKGLDVPVVDVRTGQRVSIEDLVEGARKEWPGRFDDLLAVYSEWKGRGFGVKSGLKFGGATRVYDVGSSPFDRRRERRHSNYMLNPIRKDDTIRALDLMGLARLAASVKKAAMYAIVDLDPATDLVPVEFDFLYYPKVAGEKIIKEKIPPQHLVKVFAEHEELSPRELASIYEKGRELGTQVILSIVSREFSLSNYYVVGLQLEGSPTYYVSCAWFTSEGY